MKTIAIVGAGPGLGLAVARTFGRHGYRVALVARRQESLDQMAATLASKGIEAKGFVADVTDEPSIARAFAAIKSALGPVGVLEYSPMSMEFVLPSKVTTAVLRKTLEFQVLGTVACVQQVLPDMLARETGAILLTGGRAAIVPMARIGSLSPAAAALRNYAYTLHEELMPQGIYAGTVTICVQLTPERTEKVAALQWNMVHERNRVEEVYGATLRLRDGFPVLV